MKSDRPQGGFAVDDEPQMVQLYDPYRDAYERGIDVGFLPIETANTLWLPEQNAIVVSSQVEDEWARRYLLAHALSHISNEGSILHRSRRLGLITCDTYERAIHARMIRHTLPTWLLEAGLTAGRYADEIAHALRVPVYVLAERIRVMTPVEYVAFGSRARRLLWPTDGRATAPVVRCGSTVATDTVCYDKRLVYGFLGAFATVALTAIDGFGL